MWFFVFIPWVICVCLQCNCTVNHHTSSKRVFRLAQRCKHIHIRCVAPQPYAVKNVTITTTAAPCTSNHHRDTHASYQNGRVWQGSTAAKKGWFPFLRGACTAPLAGPVGVGTCLLQGHLFIFLFFIICTQTPPVPVPHPPPRLGSAARHCRYRREAQSARWTACTHAHKTRRWWPAGQLAFAATPTFAQASPQRDVRTLGGKRMLQGHHRGATQHM